MTPEQFRARYTVLDPVLDDSVRSTPAYSAPDGTLVLLHDLGAAGEPPTAARLAKLRTGAGGDPVTPEVVEIEGRTIAVTPFTLEEYHRVGRWAADRSVPAAPPPGQPRQGAPPGEFTQLFGSKPDVLPPVSDPRAADGDVTPQGQSGDFTRFFVNTVTAAPGAAAESAGAPDAPPAGAERTSGERPQGALRIRLRPPTSAGAVTPPATPRFDLPAAGPRPGAPEHDNSALFPPNLEPPNLEPAPVAARPPQSPAPTRSAARLLLALNAVVIAVIATVLYVALR